MADSLSPELAARINTLSKPENFSVTVAMKGPSFRELSAAEWRRFAPKLTMVEDIAAGNAGAMLKGTLKYERDDWPVETWLRHGIDDGTDNLMYWYLIQQAMRRDNPEIFQGHGFGSVQEG